MMDLIIPEDLLEVIRAFANNKGILTSQALSLILHVWYEENKDNLTDFSCKNNMVEYSFSMDEETQNIYELFIRNSLKNIILSMEAENNVK